MVFGRSRIIPILLIDRNGGLVKTVRFGKRTYIGDPINAVKIFNDKEVDELAILDIDAGADRRPPAVSVVEDIVSEAFMPVSYGGGITSLRQVLALARAGIEKVILRTAAIRSPELILAVSEELGSQSVVACLDARKTWRGHYRLAYNGQRNVRGRMTPLELAADVVQQGAGELIVQSVDRDGTYRGYDLALLREISSSVTVPVVACGGAGSVDDFYHAVADAKCAAVAAGSMFVYQHRGRGVLISYPDQTSLRQVLYDKAV